MKKYLFLLVSLLSVVAMASGGEGHEAAAGHGEAVPLAQIGWQAVNLGILLVALFFFLKSSIIETFANRKQSFLDQAEKTKSALKNAELALSGVKQKLSDLESGEAVSLQKAKAEAEEIKANLIKDAEALSEKLKKDATLSINNELNKAKTEINNTILNSAIGSASKTLANKATSNNLEAAFLKQLDEVKP